MTNAENVFCLSFCQTFYMAMNCGVCFKTNKMGAKYSRNRLQRHRFIRHLAYSVRY